MHRHEGSTRAEALDCLLTTAKLAPNDPDVFYFIGVVQSEMGQHEKPSRFPAGAGTQSFHASAEFALARVFQRLGKADKAPDTLLDSSIWCRPAWGPR